MTRSSMIALPRCSGPKLSSFEDPKATIELENLISESDLTDSSRGGHAHVFEVSIQSKTYALKIFKFYDATNDYTPMCFRSRPISIDLFRGHMDPFFNECRAYGRLIEHNANGEVAVRCYGYLMIPASREDDLRECFGVTAWNRPREEYTKPVSRRQPFRAIAKDLVTEDVPLTAKIAKMMLRDLRTIREFKIYKMKIRASNYKGGHLVDFGSAMTTPHILFFFQSAWQTGLHKSDDLGSFDHMLDKAAVVTVNRAMSNQECLSKLRPRDKKGRATKPS